MNTSFNDRLVNAVSAEEMRRRWTAVRRGMREAGIDALVMQNSSDWVGGYVRWFTNQPATNGYPTSVVFPVEGDLTMVEQGPFGGSFDVEGAELELTGVGRRLTTPSYPSICYTGEYDAALVVKELDRLGAKRVGLVAPAAMYHAFGATLRQSLGADRTVDGTVVVDRVKAIKSAEEQMFIRRVTAMQDEVMAHVAEWVRPGVRDFEIAAHAQHLGQLLGSEQGIHLCSSAPPGVAPSFKPRWLQGRTLQQGDIFSLLIETNGAGGFYAELSRMFVLGRATAGLRDAHQQVIAAQEHAVTLLRPGVRCADVYAQHNDWLREHGLPDERRLSIHGMGIDMVERPLVRHDEDMKIEAGMAIVVHPAVVNKELFVHNTQLYLIGSDGPAERLHRTSTDIVEIAGQ